jgi:hypothetical protein
MPRSHPAKGFSTGPQPSGACAWVLALALTMSASCNNNETPAGSGGTGGTGPTGGTPSGGFPQTGGALPTGGVIQTGGTAQATGGTSTGGVKPTGGTATGGVQATGGTSTGGAKATGGTPSGGANQTGGVSQTGGSGGTRPGWIEEWNTSSPARFYLQAHSPGSATPNQSDTAAHDGRALRLLLGANPQSTPAGASEVGTNARVQFGTYSSRLRTADCTGQPNAGVVTGFFTFFNDGSDSNGDGLPDNSEIDFEWLCAAPEILYLTMWTDYRDSDSAQKRVSRGVNLATGTILYTCYYTSFGDCAQTLSGAEAAPSTIAALAGYNSASSYYEYGIDWASDSVVWWLRNPQGTDKIVLWDYRGPKARITQVAAALLTNVWHTSDWPPEGKPNAIQPPTQAVSAWVDWTRYEAP